MYHNNSIIPQKYNKFGIESKKFDIFLDFHIILREFDLIICPKILLGNDIPIKRRFFGQKGVGDEVVDEVSKRTMPRVLHLANIFELVVNGFNNCPFS